MTLTITHIGVATMLLEIGSLRLLTDPVFDPVGGRYSFGWGTGSTKLTAPSVSADHLGAIDAVLAPLMLFSSAMIITAII